MPFPDGIMAFPDFLRGSAMSNHVTQSSPESNSNTGQSVLKMTIEIKGQETDDLQLALEEVMRLLDGGFTSGFDRNETGSYRFFCA